MYDMEPKLFQTRILVPHLIFDLAADNSDALGDTCLKRLALRSRRAVRVTAQVIGDLRFKTAEAFAFNQLANLLENVFTPDRYAANVKVKPNSNEMVDFAIKLPGRGDAVEDVVWLPIDAKFPKEQFERMQNAQDAADADAFDAARKELFTQIKLEAKSISDKYISPPHTTDFAVMFLPTEGLYAEVAREAGLLDLLQREHRIVVAGPTTLTALLNSLHMGFRTLAMEKRASEVWQVLGAVKTEFGKFGDVLAKTKQKLESAAGEISKAETRTRAMSRALSGVEQMEGDAAVQLLGLGEDETKLVKDEVRDTLL